ncbi:hypothetical protein E6P09_09775 [Haloferax mediterranei ATCC 33500]|uniref:Uncharacterized protein n=1 Tax=Haloferax mediterranei (strain ATCC 33500 / DSM 1411 / JCM 8866 / NBRC 14739 / NCIMB 2177 / R-4) TaxID=523841 RepID=M0J6T7_HALMT|nr:hypothetical protein [Haloferax mediterranei]AHZ21579.1 hypothetical protein BM92_02435 [Haloferax mediterranei ATCC 33500]EMA04043.1 hypothetical protein C439_03758 [Haloferax mediterranei ATCC 33500]MDX5989152.1 hypothetical protein [Haloferax mediterranei ATCC 33500]QCQ75535.1 hypothetical protein E6P09_09775 [Haloferax mediterranei ATCC 33500]
MGGSSKQLVRWLRGPATGNSAMGIYGLVTAMVALFLTYSIVATLSVVVPLLSTTVIIFTTIVVWVVTWAILDIVASRTLREPSS